MRTISTPFIASLVILSVPLVAQETTPRARPERPADQPAAQPGDSWTKSLTDRAERGTLRDGYQYVRGDSGKWNDEPRLQHAPPLAHKPPQVALDDWADRLTENDFQPTGGDEVWLLFRTRQLDDNDRVWVERIERRGNQFTLVVSEAVWQGRYSKNFTYYSVIGVSLGRLPSGRYEAKCVVQPLEFNQFEDPSRRSDSWPKDERPSAGNPTEMSVTFTVAATVP